MFLGATLNACALLWFREIVLFLWIGDFIQNVLTNALAWLYYLSRFNKDVS